MAQVPRVYVDYTGNASRTIFDFDFPYQNASEVFVTVDGVITPYSWPAGSTASVQVLPAPPLGANIRIYRSTMAYNPLHVFAAGVPFLPRYVDENNRQLIYVVQEAVGDTAAKAELAYEAAIRAEAKVDAAIIDSAAKLRSDLGASNGAQLVKHGALTVGQAIDATNAAVSGLNTSLSALSTSVAQAMRPPTFKRFAPAGKGLIGLRKALGDPFCQYLGIVFIGDSITWGSGSGDAPSPEPRNGTLKDVRDNYASRSYVNIFKRYIQEQYQFGAVPVLSNFPASPSGESTVDYTRVVTHHPDGGRFVTTLNGSSMQKNIVFTPASITGAQVQIRDGNTAATSSATVTFPFTGKSFTLSFGVEGTIQGLDYELLVNGSLIGTYTTTAGEDGLTMGNDRRRVHTFPYVKDATITIRSKRRVSATGTVSLRLEGIILNRQVRIVNQGINGASTVSYRMYNMAGNTQGNGVAVQDDDTFVFCQLGTNDRITASNRTYGPNTFYGNLVALLGSVPATAQTILMCSNPAANESPATYNINMQDVRGVIYNVAESLSCDFIDNYAIYRGMASNTYTADGLHPNAYGYLLMANNIIGALEAS